MSKFTERLWRDLEREHGSELAQIEQSAAHRTRFARPRLLAGTTVALAVAGAAVILVLSAASTPAAFAVTGNSDGTYSVVLKRLTGIKGANERLAALGVRAKFVQVMAGCRAGLPPAAVANLRTPGQVLIHSSRVTRIDPRKIPPGRMVMIVSWAKARSVHVAKLGAAVTTAAPDCVAGPPPRALRIAWGLAHGCHIAVAAVPREAIIRKMGKSWTLTREDGKLIQINGPVPGKPAPPTGNSGAPTGNSGPFTGNSGAPTGNSGPFIKNPPTANSGPVTAKPTPMPPPVKFAKGCPKPAEVRPGSPGTGNSGNSVSTGNSGNSSNSGSTGNSG
jgi:hypothetical protein